MEVSSFFFTLDGDESAKEGTILIFLVDIEPTHHSQVLC